MRTLAFLLTTAALLVTTVTAFLTVTPVTDKDTIVQCHTGTSCEGDGDTMTMMQCCLNTNTDMHFSTSRGRACHQCVVYGWLDDSVVMRESYDPHKLRVGYLLGSGPELTFRVIIDQGTTLHKIDYTVSPQLITISPGAPSVVVVDTFVDGLALEEDELFTLRLELVGDTAPGLLRPSLPITLVDTDVLKVSMASADYRVSESNGTMTVVIKKDKRIATPLALRLSPHTVAQAMMWSGVTLPNIPTDFNPNSPNRARAGQDFDARSVVVYFQADEDAPSHDLPVSVKIFNDSINEAPEEYFVVRWDTVDDTNSLVEVGEERVSLCRIVDDDPIRIGFTQSSYTIKEGQHHSVVRIARENESEQSFYLLIEAVVASPSPSIAPVSNKFAHNVLTSNSRVILQVLSSDMQEKEVHLYLDPYLLQPEVEVVAFELILSSELSPFFLPAKNKKLYQSTYIIIEPSKP